MILNTTETIKQLDGKDAPDMENKPLTVGNYMATIISMSSIKTTDAMRTAILALKLSTDDKVELNTSDVKYLTDIIKQADNLSFKDKETGQMLKAYPTLAIGQLLIALDSMKQSAEDITTKSKK